MITMAARNAFAQCIRDEAFPDSLSEAMVRLGAAFDAAYVAVRSATASTFNIVIAAYTVSTKDQIRAKNERGFLGQLSASRDAGNFTRQITEFKAEAASTMAIFGEYDAAYAEGNIGGGRDYYAGRCLLWRVPCPPCSHVPALNTKLGTSVGRRSIRSRP